MRESDNVEVDCLGERAKLQTSEGQALLACQSEVQNIREKLVAQGKTPQEKQRNEAIFYGALSLYMEQKDVNEAQPPSLMQRFFGGGAKALNVDVAKDFARQFPNLADRFVLKMMSKQAAEEPVPAPGHSKTTAPPKDESRVPSRKK